MAQYRSETESSTEFVEYTAFGDVSSSDRRERRPKPSSLESTFGNQFEEEEGTEESPLEEAQLASEESSSDSFGAAKKRSRPAITFAKRDRKKKSGKPIVPMLDSLLALKIEGTVYSEAVLLPLRVEYQIPSNVTLRAPRADDPAYSVNDELFARRAGEVPGGYPIAKRGQAKAPAKTYAP
ncbi:hypothetical protein NE237_025354 [Protea cynaroides]|uniref:Uncharacterized protein n=1 Tax=Protea cynaroides TaxID=273540 RepID=A0A9Q0H281_9MAGN|nr:hypothetical protein NE237_025354 [Protea cynaroides]